MNKLYIDREMSGKRQNYKKKKTTKQWKDKLFDRTCVNVMNRCLSYQVIWF